MYSDVEGAGQGVCSAVEGAGQGCANIGLHADVYI